VIRFRVIVLAATAWVIAGCGSGGPLPPEVAGSLVRGLDDLEQKVRAGECRQTRATLQRLDQTARSLPEGVDEATRETLESGVDHLGELLKTQCKQKPKPRRKKKAEPRISSPPVQSTPEPEPRVIGPQAQPEPTPEQPMPEQPQSDTQPTPEPEQPPPTQPEMPDMPDLPNPPDPPN
jgi:predicted small lipoprotein YifL